MLTSLTLKNWRTHSETTLEFGKGTNVIVGVMGSGKSSIVNAISYALFGTFPAVKGRLVTLEEVIMNKPNEQIRAETIIEFTQEENKYKVERIIKRDGTNEAKLYENEKFVAGPKQKDVNERVEKLLGLNYELFSRAVYAEQNELDFFLKLSPSERKKKFDELLDLAKYEDARKNSNTLQNELLKENKQRKDAIEQQQKTIHSHEEEKLLKQIRDEEIAIKQIEAELKNLTKVIENIEKEYKILIETEKQHKTIEELLLKTNSRIEGLKEDIQKGEKINLVEIKTKIEHLTKDTLNAKENYLLFEKEQKENETLAKKVGEEIKVLEYERKKQTEEEKSINGLTGKCPTCKQELNETHKHNMTKEITEKLRMINTELSRLLNEKNELNEKVTLSEKNKNKARKEQDDFNKELYKLEAMLKEAQGIEEKKKQLCGLNEELPKIEKMLTQTGFDKKKLNTTRDELYAKKSEIAVGETKVKSKQELKKSYELILKKIAEIKKNIEEQEKYVIQTENAAKKIGVFSNCLSATQVELRQLMIETTNEAMNIIWSAVYPYKDFTDARLSIVEDGYDLEVKTRNDKWVRVEGILSGGERSAAALCIRIAFALVLTKKLSMIILDEPTHNLDSNTVLKLSTMLRDDLPKLVEQIFIITHDKELKSAASSNLYLLTRNKDTDESTKIETLNIN